MSERRTDLDADLDEDLDEGFAAAMLSWFGEDAQEPEPQGRQPVDQPTEPAEPSAEPYDEPEAERADPDEPAEAVAAALTVEYVVQTDDQDANGEQPYEHDVPLVAAAAVAGDGDDDYDEYTTADYRDGAGSRWVLALVVLTVIAMLGVAMTLGSDDKPKDLRADGTSTTLRAEPIGDVLGSTSTTGATGSPSTSAPTTATTAATGTTTSTVASSTTTASTIPGTTLTTLPPAPAHLTVSGPPLSFGTALTTMWVDVANSGGTAMSWSARTTMVGTTVTPVSGTLAPGAHGPIAIKLDRATAPEGPRSGQLVLTSSGGNVTLSESATVNHPPVIWSASASPTTIYIKNDCGADRSTVTSVVSDDSAMTVVLVYDGGPGVQGRIPMIAHPGSVYTAVVGPFQHMHDYINWWVEATDVRGNLTRSVLATITVLRCNG